MKKYFLRLTKISLVLVYFVIIAGALVRMTGSGMGCPDWPKCFGYYIPPTDIKQLTWEPNREFEAGQVIIKDQGLLVAKNDFKTASTFDSSHWRPYTKHDYAVFNPKHTWIEYLNRLAGALAGFAVFLMAVSSFSFWKENKKIVWLSWLTVIMMGIQGWLGAKVVYSVLNPIKITLHMVVALLIVAILIYIIKKTNLRHTAVKNDSLFRSVLAATLICTLIQIALGTQVRQFVDEQVKILGYDQMQFVFNSPAVTFYIHRSFSFLVLGLNLFLFLRNRKLQLGYNRINKIMILIVFEILSGIAVYYFDFPSGSQAIHLIIASILFGQQFYLLMESRQKQELPPNAKTIPN